MSKIKNVALDQYGAEPFEQQQLGTAGVEGVKSNTDKTICSALPFASAADGRARPIDRVHVALTCGRDLSAETDSQLLMKHHVHTNHRRQLFLQTTSLRSDSANEEL